MPKKRLPQKKSNARPKERHTGVAGDPQSMAIAAALNDAATDKVKATSDAERALSKKVKDHPVNVLLRRVARDDYTPTKDEIASLNLPAKARSELGYAIRHVARLRDQPLEVEERKNAKGTKVINAGYTSPAYIAQNKADELGSAIITDLPPDYESRLDIKRRHAAEDTEAKRTSDDSDAIADRVWRGEHS